MGASLVAEVLARWTHVSDRAFRVLVRMALTALDKPSNGHPAGLYHGGRDLLAMSLRSDKGSDETRYRAVKRALAELTEAGAIQHLQSGWSGRNAVYRLNLRSAPAIDTGESEGVLMGGQISPPEGGPTSPPKGGSIRAERGAPETPPRNQEEPIEELKEEETAAVDLTSHRSRATRPTESASVIQLFPKPPDRKPQPGRGSRVAEALAESTERRRIAVAQYQARVAAGDAP